MKIVGIDTNALITYRLERQPGFEKVNDLFKKCILGKVKIFLPTTVFLETEWVLRSVYKQSKEEIIDFFEEILLIDNLILKEKKDLELALNIFENSSGINFSDSVILVQIQSAHPDEFLTFDQTLKNFYKINLEDKE